MKKFNSLSKSILLVCATLFHLSSLSALEYYWVGGSGLWSDHNNHWATTSGGAVFHDQVPQSTDNVHFDANSFPAGGTVTIDQTIIYCMDMDWTGAANMPVLEGPGDKQVWIYGSLKLIAGMQWNVLGEVHFLAFQPGKTITTDGKNFISWVFFNGVGGEWTFLDEFTVESEMHFSSGTIHTNNQTVNAYYFIIECIGSSALYLGSSTVNITAGFQLCNPGPNFIFDAGTSTIICGYISGINLTFYNVIFNGQQGFINGSENYFHSALFTNDGFIFGSNTFENLTFSPGYIYGLSGNQTITPGGQLNASGTDCSHFVTIRSQSAGQQAGIIQTTGTVPLSYVILQDMAASGGATFSAANSVDLGNNSGWTITPITSRTLYWVGGSGSWNDPTHWSLASGGAGGECVPTPYDNVFFDANSSLSSGSIVEANNAISYCHDMTWTGITGNPEFKSNAGSLYLFGSLTLSPTMNYNYNGRVFFMASTLGETILMAGQSFHNWVFFNGVGGEWTFLDEFTVESEMHFSSGTIHTNNQTVNAYYFIIECIGSSALYLGSSTVNITAGFQLCNPGPNFIFDAGTSTIICGYISGINLTFYNVIFNGQQGFINGSENYFHSALFTNDGFIFGSNTFENLTFSPGYTYIIVAASTQTITPLGNFIAEGFGGFPIEIKSTQLGSQATLHKDGDPVCLDFLYLTDIAATGTAFTYAGANSDDVFNNSGWLFQACPNCFTAPPLPAPTLDPASVTTVSQGQSATLILQNLPAGYEAVWFDANQATELYASVANLFQPVINQSTTFYGAFRELATGCVSEVLTVAVVLPCVVNITNLAVTPESCLGAGNGGIVITAVSTGQQLAYSITGGQWFNLTGEFHFLSPGVYDILVWVLGDPTCSVSAVATVNPGSPPQTWYKDWDNDGYSDGVTLQSCPQPPGFKLAANLSGLNNDCNDYAANIHPGAAELCNGVDDNCDGNPESPVNTWTGLGDGINWSDPANWSGGIVPLSCQDVVIPAGSTVTVIAGFNAVGKTLNVAVSAVLLVELTSTLNIVN